MELELIRTYFVTGTNGALLLDGELLCATIELPWKDNKHVVSCIPEGRYALYKRYSPRLGWHLQVMDVPGRRWILIHPANDAATELQGCIAPVACLTGIGKGNLTREAFGSLTTLVFPLLNEGRPVFLTIKSRNDA